MAGANLISPQKIADVSNPESQYFPFNCFSPHEILQDKMPYSHLLCHIVQHHLSLSIYAQTLGNLS